jgi:DNA-binding MarR family transcriptional regulator
MAELGRERSLSRQHIRAVMQELLELGLVEEIPNPRHRGANFVGLTREGEKYIDTHDAKVVDCAMTLFGDKITSGEVHSALRVITIVNESIADYVLRYQDESERQAS